MEAKLPSQSKSSTNFADGVNKFLRKRFQSGGIYADPLREKRQRGSTSPYPAGLDRACGEMRYRDIIRCMAQLLVRQLDDDVKAKLQLRARRHGRSTEEEVREILANAVREEGSDPTALGSRLAARFAAVGLVEEIPELRGHLAQPADFES
jgi:plasmid stability protein